MDAHIYVVSIFFHYDYIPSDEEELQMFKNMYTIVYTIAREFNQYTIEERETIFKIY